MLAGSPGEEVLPESGRVVLHLPLARSWWLSSGFEERRANGVAPKPGPSGSPSARGARMSASCAPADYVRHQRVRHTAACRPLGSRPKTGLTQRKRNLVEPGSGGCGGCGGCGSDGVCDEDVYP